MHDLNVWRLSQKSVKPFANVRSMLLKIKLCLGEIHADGAKMLRELELQ